MERKIGEIFEYNGEWYQCLPEILICVGCAFKKKTCKEIRGIRGECERASRQTDGVIFKKLEKVGEPYEYFVQHRGIVMLQPYKLFATPFINGVVCNVNYDTNTIDLEIKQTKEDMEENKMHDTKEDIPEFDKVVDECLFGKDKLNLKPFDIQKAKEGKPVCTRDGRKARIIAFDRRQFYKNVSYPILALVERSDGEDDVCGYNEKGKVLIEDGAEYKDDLMMLPEKKEGWVNVYKDSVYDTKDDALIGRSEIRGYIDTIKISWEE